MTRWADTGSVPPATGVIVNAAALLAGLRTVNIELILVEMPSADSWSLAKSNTMSEYADSKGVTFIDLNLHLDEMDFDWTKSTPDGGDHLNIYGAEKTTEFIGKYLNDNYNLPDRRNDEDYSIWYEDSEIFHRDVENAKKEAQNN